MAYVPPHRRRQQHEIDVPPHRRRQQHGIDVNPIPIVTLTNSVDSRHTRSRDLIRGLSSVGFALVSAPDITPAPLIREGLDQCAALMSCSEAGSNVLGVKKQRAKVFDKRIKKRDFKESVMLRSNHVKQDDVLDRCWEALQQLKLRVLRVLELHFGIDLVNTHQPDSDSMRLLHYPTVTEDIAERLTLGHRCYAHVDYGTITLLLMTRPGLEVESGGEWIPVPYQEGTVAVNVGMELAKSMSGGRLRAAMHRVPGPCSSGSRLALDDRRGERYAIALFVQKEHYKDSAGKGRKAPKDHAAEMYHHA